MHPIGISMGLHHSSTSSSMEDIERSSIYSPLTGTSSHRPDAGRRRPMKVFISALTSSVLLLTLGVMVGRNIGVPSKDDPGSNQPFHLHLLNLFNLPQLLPEVYDELTAKPDEEVSYKWTNTMLKWQRTECHFQPEENWLGGPTGPLYHAGLYHLFYEYNPESTTSSGNVSWGHAISTDMIHWRYLPLAIAADQWFDINGVLSGSATKLSDGQIVMLYTGITNYSVSVQNAAFPANMSDPFLINWFKFPFNPVLEPPPPTENETTVIQGPSTAWMRSDGVWFFTVGATQDVNGEQVGSALLYNTTDFGSYTQQDVPLHEVEGQSSWGAMDFYPVATIGEIGVETSAIGPNLKHVLKASISATGEDFYAIGCYDPATLTWTPDNPEADIGSGLKYDYGTYYASKTFFDEKKQHRILFGLINETDSKAANAEKGWAGVHAIPRTVLLDTKTGSNLLQWPIGEIDSLHKSYKSFSQVSISPGQVVALHVDSTDLLDIIAEFEVELASEVVEDYNCSNGAAERSTMGPFGFLVLTDLKENELTPIYFRPVNTDSGNRTTCFCTDTTRSSVADDVTKVVYGTDVPVLKDEKYTMRVIIDHSVVESFAQKGRKVISTRVYPTKAINGNAGLYLFNNATGVTVKANLKAFALKSAYIGPYPSHNDYVSHY